MEQSSWLIKDAFSGAKGKDVIIFSHRIAKSYFENGKNPFAYQGYSTERMSAIVQQAKADGINIMAWFGGGYGFDAEIEFADIKYAVINSQLPSDLQVKEINGIRVAENRDLGTLNQECWDLVLLNQKEGKIRLYRFGCGEDRVI